MHKRSNEPFVWLLFSAGGVVAALFIPMQLFLLFVAFPLGWLNGPTFDTLLGLVKGPIGRLYLLVLCTLALFHWAHRFRYTLYDGLQIKHLNELVNTFCYGGAIVGTAVAAYLIWQIP